MILFECVKLKHNKLSERLEASDGEDVLASIANKEAQAVPAKDNSRNRREAQKNSFGEPKAKRPGSNTRKE